MLRSLLSMLLSLLLAVTPLYAAPTDNRAAGEVKALIPSASRNAQALNVRDSLQWNDLLKTETQGRLRAGLIDGSILSLGSNSELKVVKTDVTSQQTSIEVNYGKLRSQVVKVTKPDGKYEVRTPNAVIGVIGTDFYVGYANNQTTVICYVGKVAVTPTGGGKVIKSDNKNPDSTRNNILLAAGEMIIIGLEIPSGGYQPSLAPAALMEASMQDTNVPDQPVSAGKKHSRRLRKVLLAVGLAAGLGLGLGIAESGGSSQSASTSTPTPTPSTPTTETINFANQFGTVNATDAGITSKGSELQSYNGIVAPPKAALGRVIFSTGAFMGTSILTGGTFSSAGSSFMVTSAGGNYGQPPKGNILSGSFVGPVNWTLVSQTGKYTDNFTLSGAFSGTLYTGSSVTGTTTQNITLYKNQWMVDHEALIRLSNSQLNVTVPSKMALANSRLNSATGRNTRRALFGWSFRW